MRAITVVLSLLMFPYVAAAQNPDPSKWMCRNLAQSGGYLYQGETVFDTQACRPIPQAALQSVAATVPRHEVTPTASATSPNAAAADAPPSTGAASGALSAPTPKINDGKVRLYVTDEPKDESIFLASHRSGWQVNGNSSGQVSGSGGSAGAAYGYAEKGADPRTIEVQADLYKTCPSIVVTNDPSRADYALLFRRQGGKRSQMFVFGGLTGLALSAHMKVDGASVFDTNGDMVYATRARTVETTIKEVCGHLK